MSWRLVKLDKGLWRAISESLGTSVDFVMYDIFEKIPKQSEGE